jgi:hypothetical protein
LGEDEKLIEEARSQPGRQRDKERNNKAVLTGFLLFQYWKIETDYEKVFFLSECSVSSSSSSQTQNNTSTQQQNNNNAVPSSSSSANIVTMRYPEPMDLKSLSRADLVILSRIAKGEGQRDIMKDRREIHAYIHVER